MYRQIYEQYNPDPDETYLAKPNQQIPNISNNRFLNQSDFQYHNNNQVTVYTNNLNLQNLIPNHTQLTQSYSRNQNDIDNPLQRMSVGSKFDRVNVWKDTIERCTKGMWKSIQVKPSIKFNQIHAECKQYTQNTKIEVMNMDTINATILLKSKGYNPLLLNMSDDKVPGGCVASGSPAQEENLFRRSNYFQHLTEDFYPLTGCSVVYSPNVFVFKSDEASSYSLLQHPILIDIIACPALRFPQITNDFKHLADPRDVELMLEKIRMIFKCAYIYGHDSIVLSAHGCGAWGNPPEHMSQLYTQVIQEYKGCFKYIIFAILNEHNKNNYQVFGKNIPKYI